MKREDLLELYVTWDEAIMPGSPWIGGTRRFTGLTVDGMEMLVSYGYLDPKENQNDSPTTEQYLEFMKKNPGFLATGYVVSEDRSDSRITIEGLEGRGDTEAFTEMFENADEFEVDGNYGRCWYD